MEKSYIGLIEIASNNSVWRGMDYYNSKKVVTWDSSEDGVYDGKVSGSKDNTYTVHIDTVHPRKSICYEEMKKYVKSLSKTELQEQLLEALLELEE